MRDLQELYQEVILDHNKRPRNFRVIPGSQNVARGANPLCGDQITVYLRVSGQIVEDVSFEGSGCAISTASASLMTEAVKTKSRADAEKLIETFHRVVTGTGLEDPAKLGKLVALAGVRDFPLRVKCATLAWHTLGAALDGHSHDLITTE